MSSKGATLSLKEVSRNTADGHAVIRYRMFTSGLPEDAVYSLLMYWQLGGLPQTVLTGITLDEKGIAVCAGKPQNCGDAQSKPNDPIDLTISGGLGEPKRVGLISRDKTAQVFASVVPFPNRATDAGCVLEARLVTPNAEAVMLFGSGFEPGGRLNWKSLQRGEKQHPAASANQNGTYSSVILPFKKGLAKGQEHGQFVLKNAIRFCLSPGVPTATRYRIN